MVSLWQVTGEVAPHSEPITTRARGAAAVDDRQPVLGDMLEGRVDLLLRLGKRDPGLDPAQLRPVRRADAPASAPNGRCPRPAVIRLTAPGSIVAKVPSESRWSIAPANR